MRRKDSDPDGRGRIPESDRGEVTFVVEDDGEIARLAVVGDSLDGLVEDPWMSTADVAQCRGSDPHRKVAATSTGRLDGHPSRLRRIGGAGGAANPDCALFRCNSIPITLHNEDFRPFVPGWQGLDRVP